MNFMGLTCQLHTHTTESKGTRVVVESITRPKKAIDFCKKNKIDVLAITDHNTTAAYPKMKRYAEKKGILLIKGIEIDTADGHIIGLDVGKCGERPHFTGKIRNGHHRETNTPAAGT